MDKADKNAVFYLNYLPVTESWQCVPVPRNILIYSAESEVKQRFPFHSTSSLSRRGQQGSVEKQKMDIEIGFSDYETTDYSPVASQKTIKLEDHVVF